MDLLGLSRDAGALPPLPLPPMPLPAGGGALAPPALPAAALPLGMGVGAPPLPGGKPAPLKTSSLSRLDDLQAYLRQCDDQHYLDHFVKALTAMPRDLLGELAAKFKARSAWLSAEEQREYKRAKLLNVMGAPCFGSPGAAARGAGGAAGAAAAAADADAFCSQVLAGGSGGTPAPPPRGLPVGAAAAAGGGGGMQLERLEMDLGAHSFMTPADAAKPRMRVLQLQPAAAPSTGGAQARSPDDVLAGVTDHQIAEISPDGQQPAAAGAAPLQASKPSGGARSGRQTTLGGGKAS